MHGIRLLCNGGFSRHLYSIPHLLEHVQEILFNLSAHVFSFSGRGGAAGRGRGSTPPSRGAATTAVKAAAGGARDRTSPTKPAGATGRGGTRGGSTAATGRTTGIVLAQLVGQLTKCSLCFSSRNGSTFVSSRIRTVTVTITITILYSGDNKTKGISSRKEKNDSPK